MFEAFKTDSVLRNKTFLVTANDYKVLDYADRVLFFENGRIKFNGTAENFKSSQVDPNLSEYLQDKTDSKKRF